MKNTLVLSLLLTATICTALSKKDSLLVIYKSTSHSDSLRYDALLQVIYLEDNTDSTRKYIDLLKEETSKLNSPYWQTRVLLPQAWITHGQNNTDSTLALCHKALQLASLTKHQWLIANVNSALGYTYFTQTDNSDTARFYLKNAIAIRQTEDSLGNSNLKEQKKLLFDLMRLANLVRYYDKDYANTWHIIDEALSLAKQINDTTQFFYVYDLMAKMHRDTKNYKHALHFTKLALENLSGGSDDFSYVSNQIYLTEFYIKLKNYTKADSILSLTRHKIDNTVEYLHVGQKNYLNYNWSYFDGLYNDKIGKNNQAETSYKRSLSLALLLNDSNLIAQAHSNLGSFYTKIGKTSEGIAHGTSSYNYFKKYCPLSCLVNDTYSLYKCYAMKGNNRKALEYHEEYVELKDSLANEDNQRALFNQQYKFEYQQKAFADSLEFAKSEEIKDLEIEKQQAQLSSQRIGLTASGGGLLLLVTLALSVYRGKKKSDELLLNILPAETARELKAKGSAESKLIEDSTVLFTDFEGFTAMSEKVSASKLVEDINECFSAFDHIIEKHNVEKIKTIGDAYMAAGGLPTPNSTHVKDVVLAALEIAEFMNEWSAKKNLKGEPCFNIRIGLNTGPVVAGIVGIKKFQYDIWGDTVNTAARMENNGKAGKVNISGSTYALLKDDPQFRFEHRGKIEAKGKGLVEMYFVSLSP